MHYANGQLAKTGDMVRGKGYNVKDKRGNLKEIVGVVCHVEPGSESCNIQVLHNFARLYGPDAQAAVENQSLYNVFVLGNRLYRADLEYGQCDHFLPVIPD